MLKAHIIDDNGKKVGPNFSLRPVKDCLNCSHCSQECYDLKAYKAYSNVVEARNDNSRLAHENMPELFQQIREYLYGSDTHSFRIHVGGDFFSQAYLDMWIAAAQDFPRIQFLAFTKVYWLDYSHRPANLQIIFSVWPGMPMPKRQQGIPFAWLDDNSGELPIPERVLYCYGTCDQCGMCWQLSKTNLDVCFFVHYLV